ncbi:MAG: hypothetical protein M1539_04320 [Actinobacteria bacterium]|nr:hypothetical protein [Actinomycetota bacterium]MCL5883183.1 hypothetical protein [Actinomycetota bacterium]
MPESNSGATGEPARDSADSGPKGLKKINTEIFWLVVIFFLALSLRTIAAFSRGMIQFDETTYARMAQNLLAGHSSLDITGTTATHFSFLYPFMTAAFSVGSHNYVAAGYAVSVLFGSLIILPTYMFGKVMWNRRVATAAAALVAVLPILVEKSSLVDGSSVFAFWLMSAMFFGYRMQFTKRCLCGMLSGTSLGLAYLDDPSALYYLVVLFTLLVIVGFRQELANYANKAAVHFLLMFMVFAIPNVAYMSYQNSSFTINDRPNDQIYAAVNNLAPGSVERDRVEMAINPDGQLNQTSLQQGPGLIVTLVQKPVDFIKAAVRNDYNFYFRNVNGIVPVWLLPMVGLGLFKLVWTRREALKYGYFALVTLPLLIVPVAWNDTRFVLPYVGIGMLFVARGWVYLEDWSADSIRGVAGVGEISGNGKQWIRRGLAALVLVPLVVLSMWTVLHTSYPLEFRRAGEWLAANGDGEARIMSREASSSWYSGGTLVVLPYATVDQVIDYGRRNNADYLVVQRQMIDQLRPELSSLMDPAAAGPSLQPVYHDGAAGSDSETIVYRIVR